MDRLDVITRVSLTLGLLTGAVMATALGVSTIEQLASRLGFTDFLPAPLVSSVVCMGVGLAFGWLLRRRVDGRRAA